MSLDALQGVRFDPVRARVAREKVAEYVAATGDDPKRWADTAPPSFAGALLFTAAPQLLEREDVRASTRVLVHVDQRFVWRGPLPVGAELTLGGEVVKVRSRGASTFVTYELAVDGPDGRLIDSTSTFLLGEEPATEPAVDPGEPPAAQRGENELPSPIRLGGSGSRLAPLAKSASRVDLVRYAGASGDFNPIHYDHEAARAAGLEGIVVHGLLMGAWMTQLAAATTNRPDPLAELRLRFRTALRPAVATQVAGVVAAAADAGKARVDLTVIAAGVELVTGHAVVRTD